MGGIARQVCAAEHPTRRADIRQIYYWDSYWILIGLLESELNAYATDLISNFMDFIQVSPTQ